MPSWCRCSTADADEELIGVELTYLDAEHRNERDADGRSVRQLIGSGGGFSRPVSATAATARTRWC